MGRYNNLYSARNAMLTMLCTAFLLFAALPVAGAKSPVRAVASVSVSADGLSHVDAAEGDQVPNNRVVRRVAAKKLMSSVKEVDAASHEKHVQPAQDEGDGDTEGEEGNDEEAVEDTNQGDA